MQINVNPDTLSPHTEDENLVWVLATVKGEDVVDVDAVLAGKKMLAPGENDYGTLTRLQEALREVLTAHRRTFQQSMLEAWGQEIPADDEKLDAAYCDEYGNRARGYSYDHRGGFTAYAALGSEDYESIDHNEGWEYGFGAAQQVVSEWLQSEAMKAVDAGVWNET